MLLKGVLIKGLKGVKGNLFILYDRRSFLVLGPEGAAIA